MGECKSKTSFVGTSAPINDVQVMNSLKREMEKQDDRWKLREFERKNGKLNLEFKAKEFNPVFRIGGWDIRMALLILVALIYYFRQRIKRWCCCGESPAK